MRRIGIGLVLVTVVGCTDIVSPRAAENFYEYRQVVGRDTLSFKWLPADLPVKIWVASDSPLRPHLVTAIDRWQRAFLFGEFRATLVADSGGADIIVRNTPPDGAGGASSRLPALAPQCTGETNFALGTVAGTLQLPWHVQVWPASDPNAAGIEDCYRITVTHELGHALGIINPNHAGAQIGDVMYRDPVFDGLSERDQATIERLYHSRTTLTAVRRP